MKNNKFLLIYFGLIIFLSGCSFDSKTGIWSGSEKEKKRITQLEEDRVKNTEKIYSSEDIIVDEILTEKNINLSEPKKNNIWKTSNFNEQNFIGHLYLTGINKTFLKKKIGKNKFSLSNVMSSPVIGEDFIIMTDNTGTIFNISKKLDEKIQFYNCNFLCFFIWIYICISLRHKRSFNHKSRYYNNKHYNWSIVCCYIYNIFSLLVKHIFPNLFKIICCK